MRGSRLPVSPTRPSGSDQLVDFRSHVRDHFEARYIIFTNRHGKVRTLETVFDRVCRENGIVHRLTGVRSPTITGKIERFHRTLKEALLNDRRFPGHQRSPNG